jgi:outer membrane protein TolC
LGFKHQPALDAARASLNGAQLGQRGLQRLLLPRLLKPDLRFRREQSAYGVMIAEAAVTQAEWETRYAITRNFFTVQYIRAQGRVVSDVLKTLENGLKKAQTIVDSGDANVKITALDVQAIRVQLGLVKGKKSQVDNGMLKALAALREAMGLGYDYPLEIADVPLPPAVAVVWEPGKDNKGKPTKVAKYVQVQNPDKKALIAAAISQRGEIMQATAANRVFELEVQAQMKIFGWKGDTFASGSDPHMQQIPPSLMNGDYRPGAFPPEIPATLAGRRADRVARARALVDRSVAVVDKATNLVSLDVEAQYLKWQQAMEEVRDLSEVEKTAEELPGKVQQLQNKDLTSAAIIQANITSIMVRTQLNDAMHTHALALAGLERATAGAFRVYPAPAAK